MTYDDDYFGPKHSVLCHYFFYPTHTHTHLHSLSLSLPSINLPLRLVRCFNFVSHVLLSGRDLRGFRTLLTFRELLTIYPGVLTIVSLKARLNLLFMHGHHCDASSKSISWFGQPSTFKTSCYAVNACINRMRQLVEVEVIDWSNEFGLKHRAYLLSHEFKKKSFMTKLNWTINGISIDFLKDDSPIKGIWS